MAKIRLKPTTATEDEAARERHAKGIANSNKPQLYPASEVAEMSPEDKAYFAKLNAAEKLAKARGKEKVYGPQPVNAASVATEKLNEAESKANEAKVKADDEAIEEENKHTEAIKLSSKALAEQTKAFKLLSENTNLALGSTKVPDKKQGMFSAKGLLNTVGINDSGMLGGMLHKMAGNREEQSQFLKQHPELSKSDFKKMKVEEKNLSKLVAKRNDLMGGAYGLSEEAMTSRHPELQKAIAESQGKLIGTKEKPGLTPGLAENTERNKTRYGEYDEDESSPRAKLGRRGLTNVTAASTSSAASEEATIDQNKMIEEQTGLLKEIRDNTGGKNPSKVDKVKPTESKEDEGLFGGMIKSLKAKFTESALGGMMKSMGKAFSSVFSPMNIIKMLGKIAFVTYIVTAVTKGFIDGWDEFQKSGDIMKSLIAGLEGFFEVLTLGLVPKDSLTKIGEWIGSKMFDVVENLSKYISDIFDKVVDSVSNLMTDFMDMVGKIGLPRIEFDIPVVGKVGVGPFYPFKSDNQMQAPTAIAPKVADQVIQKSNEERDSAKDTKSSSNATTVVSAPTVNNRTSVIQPRRDARSNERGSTALAGSTY